MQDRYAADVGDYLTYGLLRALCAAAPDESALRLGVCWYLIGDEDHNADGKHVGYLEPSNGLARSLRDCDPDLYDRLRELVDRGDRSVAHVERCGALPPDTVTHATRLDPTMTPEGRARWHLEAQSAVAEADVVFLAPDNGIRPSGIRPSGIRPSATRAWAGHEKYATVAEVGDHVGAGHSVVVYQHADRSPGGTTVQAERRLTHLAEALGVEPVGAVVARRGSTRFFLIVPAEAQRDRLTRAAEAFAHRWSPHASFARTVAGGDHQPNEPGPPLNGPTTPEVIQPP